MNMMTNYRVPVSINQTGEYPEGYYGAGAYCQPLRCGAQRPKKPGGSHYPHLCGL